MGSLAGQTSSSPDMARPPPLMTTPDDGEAEYRAQVLRLSSQRSEADVEEELVAKATALGIPTSRFAHDKRNTSSAESQTSTIATQHVRTFSNASRDSASTTLTSHPSLHAVPIAADVPPHSLARKRSKSLSFSQYDKYLSQIDPNIHQPKIQKAPPAIPHDTTAHSLFSVTSRRSYFSIKEGIRKIRWKRKSGLLESTMCVTPTPYFPCIRADQPQVLAYAVAMTSTSRMPCTACPVATRTVPNALVS